MSNYYKTADLAKMLLAKRPDGPEPVEHNGYIVHAMGNELWIVPIAANAPVSKQKN